MDSVRYLALRCFSAAVQQLRRKLTPAGRLALAALAVSAALGVDTRQNSAHQAFTFLAALFLVSLAYRSRRRPRLQAIRLLPRLGSVGVPLDYEVEVRNAGGRAARGLSLAEELQDPRPSAEEFRAEPHPPGYWFERFSGYGRWRRVVARKTQARSGGPAELPELVPGGSCRARLRLTPLRRGVLRLKYLAALGEDPLGLARWEKPVGEEDSLLILPRRYPVPPLELPGSRRYQRGGVTLSSSVGDSQEFASLRDYRPGDPLRRIHWRTLPKDGKLRVREHQDEYFVRHALALDTFGPEGEAFEEAVSVAASFALCALTQESLLDLLFVGEESYCFTAGRGLGRAEHMLEVLACARPCRDKPFPVLEAAMARRQEALSGCILVLLSYDAQRKALVRRLQASGLPTLTLVVSEKDPADAAVRWLKPGSVAEGMSKL